MHTDANGRQFAEDGDPDPGEQFNQYLEQHKGGQRAGWNVRRAEVVAEAAKLGSYARRSNTQEQQLAEAHAEIAALDTLIVDDDVRVRSESVEHIKRVTADPANLERPGVVGGAPALVSDRRSDRLERPDEVIRQIRSNPWRDEGGPLSHRGETGDGTWRVPTAPSRPWPSG